MLGALGRPAGVLPCALGAEASAEERGLENLL